MGFTTHLELHSQATRLEEGVPDVAAASGTGLEPSMTPHPRRLPPAATTSIAPLDYNSGTRPDLQVELFPVHSPLLRESWLVSFPPLSYMLKFSGSSYLISGQNERVWARAAGAALTHLCLPSYAYDRGLPGGIVLPAVCLRTAACSYHTMQSLAPQ